MYYSGNYKYTKRFEWSPVETHGNASLQGTGFISGLEIRLELS
ncbi:MAG: hypothetical protein IEMM0008_0801 [bacterium]|nr:MAG: hypothetical protein IEMM0008_0801 [bacterium]